MDNMSKSKKILMMITLSLFMISVISFAGYAVYNVGLATLGNKITTGQVKMSYTETNEISLTNVLPTSDKKGINSSNYFEFKVYSMMTTNEDRKMNYNIVLEPLTINNNYTSFTDSNIKVYLTKVENNTETLVTGPTTINKLNSYVIKSQEETFTTSVNEHETTYRLRAWLDYNFDADKLNKATYSYKFRVNVNNEDAPKVDYALDFAKSKVGTDGLEPITHTIDNTLQVDNKFATEYRYRGGDSVVKNYVTFNNETWRIIGVIPTEDTNGNVENRFKIIRDTSIGSMKWNTTDDTATDSYNNWVTGTLNTYLNNDYYNTLTSDAKNMIGTTKYYLGGYNNTNMTSDVIWQYERKNDANKSGYYYEANPVMQNDASKKIALMYASDFGYGASKECTKSLYNYDNDILCKATNNWLNKGEATWLLPQDSDDSYNAFRVTLSGYVNRRNDVSNFEYAVRPVLSLSSNVKILGGEGTSESPYTLSIS